MSGTPGARPREVTEVLAEVVAAVIAGDDTAGTLALVPISGQTCETHPIEALPQLPGARPKGSGARTRSPDTAALAAVYLRDGFSCAYCLRRTVPLAVLRLISLRFPAEFPHHPNWKRAVTHRLYWDISTTVDHVDAVSIGGAWNAFDNLETACARCQYQKGNRSLDSLGWTRHRDRGTGWDGLTSHLLALWECCGRPDGLYAAWIRAFAAAKPVR